MSAGTDGEVRLQGPRVSARTSLTSATLVLGQAGCSLSTKLKTKSALGFIFPASEYLQTYYDISWGCDPHLNMKLIYASYTFYTHSIEIILYNSFKGLGI